MPKFNTPSTKQKKISPTFLSAMSSKHQKKLNFDNDVSPKPKINNIKSNDHFMDGFSTAIKPGSKPIETREK